MSDKDETDWENIYWTKRRAQLNNQTPQQSQISDYATENNKSIDVGQALQQKLMGDLTSLQSQQQPPGQAVFIKEGYDYYVQIQANSFGHTMPLVKSVGKLKGVSGKQFIMKGELSAYCVDNLSTVDLSKMNESPERNLILVRLKPDIFSQEILVSRGAIIENGLGSNNGNRQVLKG